MSLAHSAPQSEAGRYTMPMLAPAPFAKRRDYQASMEISVRAELSDELRQPIKLATDAGR